MTGPLSSIPAGLPRPGCWQRRSSAVLVVLLAVLIARGPGRINQQRTWLRVVTGVVIAFITLADLLAAVRLVVNVPDQQQALR